MAHHAARSVYERLTDRLNRSPQGAPPSRSLFEILQLTVHLHDDTDQATITITLPADQLPDAGGTYELPATTEDAITMYRRVFRELDEILDHDRLARPRR